MKFVIFTRQVVLKRAKFYAICVRVFNSRSIYTHDIMIISIIIDTTVRLDRNIVLVLHSWSVILTTPSVQVKQLCALTNSISLLSYYVIVVFIVFAIVVQEQAVIRC